jgi:conjugative relaxase-like TrwC/TraI family protein
VAVVLTIGRLGAGAGAANYYLERQAGCPLEYFTDDQGEPRGVWCGSGARTFGAAGVLDEAGERLMRGLLAGCGPDGTALVPPVWRGDPRGRLPAAVLVRAVEARAAAGGVPVATLLGDGPERRLFDAAAAGVATDARWPRRPRASLPAAVAGRVAVAAGLDPVELYRPADGRDLFATAAAHTDDRVDVRRSGLDLTFSVPKSVSTLFALGDPQLVEQVRAAHRAAVEQTVQYLEGLCARAARGHHATGQPQRRIATNGWAAVAFEHRASRCGDPQLHTHVVVPNLVCGVDGRWSAWDTSAAYRQASTGGYLYQAVLRGELTRRLGVSWGPVRRGVAEIDGIPAGLRRVFSKRRQAIEEHLSVHGQTGMRASQVAALATRPAKTRHGDWELRQGWRAEAEQAGFDPRAVVRAAIGTTASRTADRVGGVAVDVAQVAARVLGARGVTRRSSTFDRRVLLRAVCEAVPAGADVTVDALRRIATELVRDPRVVPLLTGVAAEARRYSTTELLATEAAALRLAAARVDDGLAQLPAAAAAAAASMPGLSVEQAAAVQRMLSSGAGVEVVVGPAGSGKTAALLAAHAAWRAAGVEVRGAALAAIAARTLQAGTGIPSQSLTRLHRATRSGDARRGLPLPGGVLVVDEAGMVGTRELAGLIDATDRARVKLVVVGDPMQLPEIDAGGLFAALTRRLPASTLAGNLRQREAWERAALGELRDGDVLAALAAYEAAGRLHLAADSSAARAAIIGDYLTARAAGRSVVMLAPRRADAQVLNTLARRALLAAGGLGADAVTVRSAGGSVEWRVGDEAVVVANCYPLGLVNGSRGRVSAVSQAGVSIDTDTGQVQVPRAVLQAGTVEHGYALTCHKAQGITVDVALLLAGASLTREAGYVAMSRGRIANHLYGTYATLLPDADPDLDQPREARIGSAERDELTRAAIVARLETRGSQRLALDSADRGGLDRWPNAPQVRQADGRRR